MKYVRSAPVIAALLITGALSAGCGSGGSTEAQVPSWLEEGTLYEWETTGGGRSRTMRVVEVRAEDLPWITIGPEEWRENRTREEQIMWLNLDTVERVRRD